MKRAIIVSLLFFLPAVASAHIPLVVSPTSPDDIHTISDPELSQTFYGRLNDFPQTYRIDATSTITLDVSIEIPDTKDARPDIAGIIIRELPEGGVTEVARLYAKDASWKEFFEPFGGDSYRQGPTYSGELQPGSYRIEVSTPDNVGPYVLVVGSREDSSALSYFETIRRIASVKTFFGKSQFLIVESPFVYVPLGILVFMCISVYLIYRRWYSRRTV